MATKKPAYLKPKSTKDQALAVGQSWLRASAAAVLALYISGITDPKVLLNAFLAGIAAPLLKALQPNEKEFGITKK
jgi:hypothetical protein